ncbi:MAG: hypothetical protein H6Q55_2138, partial [Deltaproteobacteria bacterium]|nr:hypothetical protein [Deltaproteobacteria bacterium]
SAAMAIGTLAFILAVALFLFWLWRPRSSATTPAHEPLRWAITIPLGLLASPHLYGQDVSLAVLSGMLLYDAARNQSGLRRVVGGFALVAPIASQICFFTAGMLARPEVWSACNAIILIGLASLGLVVMNGVERKGRKIPSPALR